MQKIGFGVPFRSPEHEQSVVESLHSPNGAIVLHFQVRDCYHEQELEELLETFESRGAHYTHRGNGLYLARIPVLFPWMPFYLTLKDCNSVKLVSITTTGQLRTLTIAPEG